MATTEVGLAPTQDIPASITPRQRWIDLAFVVGVALWRPLFTSTVEFLRPIGSSGSGLNVSYSILGQLSSLAVLVYVLWRRGSWFRGITLPFRAADLFWATGLYSAAKIAGQIARVWLRGVWIVFTGFPPPHVPVDRILGIHLSAPWVIYQFINPWKEELIVRGFLMSELAALAGMPVAIASSALLQTAYHLYQGPVNATALFVEFLIFSLYYARTRRLFPILIAHTLMDVLALAPYMH